MMSDTRTHNLDDLAARLRTLFMTDERYHRLVMTIEADPSGGPGQSLIVRDGARGYLVACEDGDIRTNILEPPFVDILGKWNASY